MISIAQKAFKFPHLSLYIISNHNKVIKIQIVKINTTVIINDLVSVKKKSECDWRKFTGRRERLNAEKSEVL